VLLSENRAVSVDYSIVIKQPSVATNTFAGRRESTPRIATVKGQLQVLGQPKDLDLATEWVLVLSDGRHCRCNVVARDLFSRIHRFSVTGEIA
jgi:hypothetical protein